MTDKEAGNDQEGMEPQGRNTVLIVVVVIIVLLILCCGLGAAAWFFGDSIVDLFSLAPSAFPLAV
jgi:hypothetical protein